MAGRERGAGQPLGFVHAHLDASAFTGETVGYVSVVAVTAAAAGAGSAAA